MEPLQWAWPWTAPCAARSLHQTHPSLGAHKPSESCSDWYIPFCMSIGHNTHTIPTSATERNPFSFYLPILWTTQSCWQRGQRLFCFTHKDMQQLWKEWLHSPQTTEREERTCSSHTQLFKQHLQQGSNYHSQVFITTGNFRDKTGHHWFIHWDWTIMTILTIVSSISKPFTYFQILKKEMQIFSPSCIKWQRFVTV